MPCLAAARLPARRLISCRLALYTTTKPLAGLPGNVHITLGRYGAVDRAAVGVDVEAEPRQLPDLIAGRDDRRSRGQPVGAVATGGDHNGVLADDRPQLGHAGRDLVNRDVGRPREPETQQTARDVARQRKDVHRLDAECQRRRWNTEAVMLTPGTKAAA